MPHDLILTVKLAAWKNITTLPHALDSTHAILSVLVQDNQSTIPGIYNAKSVTLPLRQSYATSVIRLVNGLVDPLQVGVYARSIASIAQQLGLPAWLVELRHAATHEDLPSLEVLREAANQVRSLRFFPSFCDRMNMGPICSWYIVDELASTQLLPSDSQPRSPRSIHFSRVFRPSSSNSSPQTIQSSPQNCHQRHVSENSI